LLLLEQWTKFNAMDVPVRFAEGCATRRLFRSGSKQSSVAVSVALAFALATVSAAPLPRMTKGHMQITSTAFKQGEPIPAPYTCDGDDTSPPLKWTHAPPGTKSFALIADDPDAPVGTWVHWVIYNLPPDTAELAAGIVKMPTLDNGASQGMNDFHRPGYGGPCPPPGKAHRYYFKLYALDAVLDLKPGATKKDLLKAMERHVVGEGQLMGTYQRK
jgi:Raf kinase inhibitor-like YbhB/YbcL family protein